MYVCVLHFTNSGSNVHVLQPSIRQLFCPFDFALDHRSSMSDSHKKRGRDDNDDLSNERPIISDTSAGDIHCSGWPCPFVSITSLARMWGPKGRAYICANCKTKWKYGEKVADEMDKKDDKKDDQKDDKTDDMDKKDESMIADG